MSGQISIQKKGMSVIIDGVDKRPIKIPSQMYPLPGQLNIIGYKNTAPFPDEPQTELIRKIYDEIEPNMGRCYTNIDQLIDALNANGIKAVPFVGWLMVGGTMPIHHCFAVIENHILDFIPAIDEAFIDRMNKASPGACRSAMADVILEQRGRLNSETTVFGQTNEGAIYFASPGKPLDGLKTYKKLLRAFPKHPSYQNIDKDGMSQMQRMLREKGIK